MAIVTRVSSARQDPGEKSQQSPVEPPGSRDSRTCCQRKAARTVGFTAVPNAVLLGLDLTPRELQLVQVLLLHRWTPGTKVWIYQKTLACEMNHCSVRTVQRTADSLVNRGLLVVEARYRDDGGRGANQYTLTAFATTVLTADGRCHDVAAPVPARQAPTTAPSRQEGHPAKNTKGSRTGTGSAPRNGRPKPLQYGDCAGCGQRGHRSEACPTYGHLFRRA